ncbi:murein hydrolase activator EnvC family protein [Glaciibacter sp. 2TAF33]|uniref:murein hydrolase activator EnvC family protein n=1 Tax=Glaciibacter sp. 2TAF33 TaxID=3233015 RepID=UPI003F929ECD
MIIRLVAAVVVAPAVFASAVAPPVGVVVLGGLSGVRGQGGVNDQGGVSGEVTRSVRGATGLPDAGDANSPGAANAAGEWTWPVAAPRTVARAFEAPRSRYAAGHRGIDVATTPGTPVFAPAAGQISFAGVVVDRPVLSIAHHADLVSSVEPVLPAVSPGEWVSAGQVIGVVASGGHCASGCLHFGVRLHGQYVSPMLMLGRIPRAVLLPLDDG